MLAIHATAVAIGREALLILGPSRSGKSRLAVALLGRSMARRPIELVGDDRVLLARQGDALIATPHPRIAGFLERRGLGFVTLPWRERAPVGGYVELGPSSSLAVLAHVPRLVMAAQVDSDARAAAVLAWWGAGRRDALSGRPTADSDFMRHAKD